MEESGSGASDFLHLTAGSRPTSPGDVQVVVCPNGSLGYALTSLLVSRQVPVRAVVFDTPASRMEYPSPTEVAQADPRSASSLAEAFRGGSVVYDCFEPRFSNWKSAMQEVTKNVLYASIEAKASLVFASHLLLTPEENSSLENDVINAHNSSLTRTAVLRMPQIYGPRMRNVLWDHIFESAADGKKAHWLGDLDVPRSLLFVEDAARMMALMGDSQGGYGRKWNLVGPAPISGRTFTELAFKAAGNQPKVGHWGRGIMLTGSLLGAEAKEFLKLPYDYYKPFVLDGSEFSAAFPGATYTPHEAAIARTLEWFKASEEGTQTTPA